MKKKSKTKQEKNIEMKDVQIAISVEVAHYWPNQNENLYNNNSIGSKHAI